MNLDFTEEKESSLWKITSSKECGLKFENYLKITPKLCVHFELLLDFEFSKRILSPKNINKEY